MPRLIVQCSFIHAPSSSLQLSSAARALFIHPSIPPSRSPAARHHHDFSGLVFVFPARTHAAHATRPTRCEPARGGEWCSGGSGVVDTRTKQSKAEGGEKRNETRSERGRGRNNKEQLHSTHASWGWAEIDRPPFHQPPTHRVALRGARRRPVPPQVSASEFRPLLPPPLRSSFYLSRENGRCWWLGNSHVFLFPVEEFVPFFLLDLFSSFLSGSSPCSPC
jgi:hypothetical protein